MLITLLLGGMQSDAQAVLARVEQYLKQAKTLSVSVKTTLNGRVFGTSSIVIDPPNRFSFKMLSGSSEFILNIDQSGILELDRTERSYDSFPPIGRIVIPPSRLSSATQYGLPRFLLQQSLERSFPKDSKPKLTKGISLGSLKADLIESKTQNQMSNSEAKAWVDASGRVLRTYTKTESPEGIVIIQYDFSEYVINRAIPASQFSTKIPIGYTPFALSNNGDALPTETQIPTTKFKSASSAQVIDLSKAVVGKSSLIVFLDPEYPNNSGFLSAVKDLAKKVSGSQTIYISVRKDAASAKSFKIPGILFDPTGFEVNKLAIPGAPFVYLTNKSGKVVQAFFGFNGTWEGLGEALDRLKGA